MTYGTDPAARPTPQAKAWSPSALQAALFIAAWLAVQLLVPALALVGPRPSPFGWQMYSSLPQVPDAWTVDADGTVSAVDVQAFFTVPRAEIDYVAALRAGLCEVTEAEAIIIRAPRAAESERMPCR